jgi:hypothetical protein
VQASKSRYDSRRHELADRLLKGLAATRDDAEQNVQQAAASGKNAAARRRKVPAAVGSESIHRTSLEQISAWFDATKSDNETQFGRDWEELSSIGTTA